MRPLSSLAGTGHPLGVSTSFIRHFMKHSVLKDMTTAEVCAAIVMQNTLTRKCAYIDLLEGQLDDQGKPFTGPATVFVSHAWSSKTVDVFATMLDFADKDVATDDNSEVFFWIDVFCNNQHDIGSKSFEWFSSTFKDTIASIGTVLQVLTPWDDPVPLRRAWCLWETFCALEMAESKGTQLVIRLPLNQRLAFLEGVAKSFDAVTNALVKIQVQRAEADQPEDRDNIFKAIEVSVGFNEVNVKVKNQLREWYLDMAVELAEEQGEISVSIINIAAIMTKNGEHDRSLELYQKALAAYGENHENAPVICNNVGEVYRAQGKYDKALEYYGKALTIYLGTPGWESRPSTAGTYNNMAAVYNAQGQYDKALEYYGKALRIYLGTPGGDSHPSTAGTYNNMANVYQQQSQYDKALEYYGKALTIRLATLGDSHPSTAATYIGMGMTQIKSGKYREEGIAHVTTGVEIYRAKLGQDHPETKKYANYLKSLK